MPPACGLHLHNIIITASEMRVFIDDFYLHNIIIIILGGAR